MNDSILRSQLEQLIREGYNLTNIATGYLKTFKKQLTNYYDGKFKAKLEILFPGVEFLGFRIILPTSQIGIPPPVPRPAPVMLRPASVVIPRPAPVAISRPAGAPVVAAYNPPAPPPPKKVPARTLPGPQNQTTLSDLESEGVVQEMSRNAEASYWRFYNTDDAKEADWYSSRSLLLGETAYKKIRNLDAGLLGRIRREKSEVLEDNCSQEAVRVEGETETEETEETEEEGLATAPIDQFVFLNLLHPFCAVCVGVQGAGKSHTMNVLLENCFIKCPHPAELPIIQLRRPMCGLVFHYDQSESNVCEAAGLRKVYDWYDVEGVKKVVILVSPSFYHQRKRFYGDQCKVVPLLFNWETLGAQQLKKLMRLSENDSQLYVSVMLNFLRDFQRKQVIPVFEDFMSQLGELCNVQGQSKPLIQRLELLKSIIYESEPNAELRPFHQDMESLLESGTLVVADLTDPMLSVDEANGIFQVLLEQFRKKRLDCGKVLACDEAHKYLSGNGNGREELASAIVDVVRLMRHDGIRVLISTQSPLALPAELLELVSLTILHSFQSKDWYTYLSSKIFLPDGVFDRVRGLYPGQALVISTKTDIVATPEDDTHCLAMKIRPRLTIDHGQSRLHR